MHKKMQERNNNRSMKNRENLKKMIAGIISGMISGFFTAGGGLIIVPTLLYVFKMEPKKARATSVFCVLPMVITTAFFYGQSNFFDWKIGIKCAIGGIVGGILGAKLLNKIHDKYLRIAFILFLLYAAFRMLISK